MRNIKLLSKILQNLLFKLKIILNILTSIKRIYYHILSYLN